MTKTKIWTPTTFLTWSEDVRVRNGPETVSQQLTHAYVCVFVCVYVHVRRPQVLRWLTVCRSTVPLPSPPPRLPPVGVGAQEDVTLLLQALYQLRAPQVAHTHTHTHIFLAYKTPIVKKYIWYIILGRFWMIILIIFWDSKIVM